MTYAELSKKLLEDGFTRVERDDRLLDVFPTETLEKGVELWQKWTGGEVEIVRLRLPFSEKKIALYVLPRPEIATMLSDYQAKCLEDYQARAIQDMLS